MIVPVLNAGYMQLGVSAFTAHDQYIPPVPPVPPLPAVPGLIEGAALGWPVAEFLHKKAPTVLVDGNPGIQQGHDIGYGIPHVAVPVNALMAVHILLSKHKVMFPVTSVLLEGKPVGTYAFGCIGGLICANPVSLPTGVLVKTKGTVETSATLGDILRGVGYVLVDVAFDMLWNKIKGRVPGFKPKDFVKSFLGPLAGTALGDVLVLALIKWKVAGMEIANKIIQHVAKSWVASPIVTGGARGAPGIGRGKAGATWKPFNKELW